MSLKKVLIGAGLAVAIPLSAFALTGNGGAPASFGGHGHGGFDHAAMPFLRGVQLTDTQRTQLHTLMQSARKDSQPIEQQLHTVHQQIEEALISTASINTAQLTSLQQQESSLRAQLDGNRLNTAIQARALLTTEQLAKAASVHQQLESLHAQERQLLGAGREFRPQAEPAQ